VYGPVRTVVWQGSAGNRRPYADQTPIWLRGRVPRNTVDATVVVTGSLLR